MIGKQVICTVAALLCILISAKAQVSVDLYREDGSRYVRSQQEVMYDDFFHAARFAVEATANAGGLVTFTLEVTYDEGLLDVAQGDSLTLILRGGDRIVLKTDREVSRAVIVKRHYRTYNDYYVTCHYLMSSYDIQSRATVLPSSHHRHNNLPLTANWINSRTVSGANSQRCTAT